MTSTTVGVWCDLAGGPTRVGTAHVSERRGTVTTSFQYDPAWQALAGAYAVSPELDLATARHQVTGLPGAVADSAPDRWGRTLVRKRLRAREAVGAGTDRTVLEVDYLLGVSDLTRQGALRYTADPSASFVAAEAGVPPLVELPRLLRAVDVVVADEPDSLAAVKALLDAGTGSLGGARPKASVRGDGGTLAIAKFPHPGDEWDVMAWEATALDLAERAGVRVPARRLVSVGGRHCLVLDRFDRDGGLRIGYVSAMTLVGGSDGEAYDYLEVAEALTTHGAQVKTDLRELFRRIALGVAVHNTDDHLRNTGFVRARSGWALSPVFDVNPNPDPTAAYATSTAFASGGRGTRWQALRESAAEFNLPAGEAEQVLAEVRQAVRDWRSVATANDVPARELDLFAEVLDARGDLA